ALSFGADEILSDVSAIVRPRDRVALVGRNGAGKTTLLRILAGELEPDRGEISLPAGTRVALHDQRPPLAGGVTLGEYVGAGAADARRLKAERLAAQADAFERQQDELAHLQRFVDRFRYGTKARQAQSKLKAMARIERLDRPTAQRTLGFRFPAPKRSGRLVVEAEGLDVAVAGRVLLHGADFAIERGQRVALIGPNGAGKTTLLETLLGRRDPAAGKIRLGHGTEPGYYSQQSLELPDAYRALDAITSGTGLTGPAARDLLGLFLFSGEDVEKPVAALSGG